MSRAKLLVAPLAAVAQPPAGVPRIGILWPLSPALLEPFRHWLHPLGYVEGQNLLIEYRWAEGQVERLPELAAELVRLPVAVIVTARDAATGAARQACRTTPIVVAITGDLVETGDAANLARPRGNVTGMVEMSPELSAKRVQFLTEVLPGVSQVAVLWHAPNAVQALDFRGTHSLPICKR